jgi:hypothetical protein
MLAVTRTPVVGSLHAHHARLPSKLQHRRTQALYAARRGTTLRCRAGLTEVAEAGAVNVLLGAVAFQVYVCACA